MLLENKMGFDLQELSELEAAPTPVAMATQTMATLLPHLSTTRFDWYGATVPHVGHEELVQFARHSSFGLAIAPKQKSVLNLHYRKWVTLGYAHGACAQIHWEGSPNNPHARLDVWGPHTPQVVEQLRKVYLHYVSRVDVSGDTEDASAFPTLMEFLERFVDEYPHRLATDFHRQAKGGEKACTYYVGSKNSETRLCVYEKGRLRGFEDHPNLVRAELRVRPESQEGKERASRMAPEEFWGWSAWSTMLAPVLLCAHVPRCAPSVKYGKSSGELNAESLAKSYGKHLPSLFELAGGSEKFGPWLQAVYERVRPAPTNRGGKRSRQMTSSRSEIRAVH
jgi:hypothetical protein